MKYLTALFCVFLVATIAFVSDGAVVGHLLLAKFLFDRFRWAQSEFRKFSVFLNYCKECEEAGLITTCALQERFPVIDSK
jgi:hypothetical protein